MIGQVQPRLGFDPDFLRPAARIATLHSPLLLIAGDADRHATLAETSLIFANANPPKELWIISGAHHQDFFRYAGIAYERRVAGFLHSRLTAAVSAANLAHLAGCSFHPLSAALSLM